MVRLFIVRLQVGAVDGRHVDEAHALRHVVGAAPWVARVDRRSAKCGSRILVKANHAHAECRLVVVELLPLGCCEGASVGAAVLVDDAAGHDDAAKDAICQRGVEGRQRSARLRDDDALPGDSVAVEERRGCLDFGVIAGDDEDGAADCLC